MLVKQSVLELNYFSNSEAEPWRQVPTTGSTTSPRERLFFSKAHTLQCPAKRNTWYSLSVLAYIKSFLLDAQQAADLSLWRPWSPSPFQAVGWLLCCTTPGEQAGTDQVTGRVWAQPALPSGPLHRLLKTRQREGPVFPWNADLFLNYVLEDKWLWMCSLPRLLKPHKAQLHIVY